MKNNIFKKKWKIADCFSGSDCWCRMIVTTDWKKDSETENSDDEIIIGTAAINKKTAEYLVKMHNKSL